MNKIDKTKDELLLELKELKQKNIALKVMFEKDITGRNNAEGSMRESEERFRSLYENSTMGLYRTTPNGKIILANPTLVKMLGYSTFEELAIRNLENDGFEPSYERKQFLEQIEKNGEVIDSESEWTCKDGTAIYISENSKAIRDSNGKTLHYDGTVENITKRKKAEETLKIRNRDLANLNIIAIQLSSIRIEPDFYKIIVTKLKDLTGASLATFGLYDFKTREINVKYVDFDENLEEVLTNSLGRAKLMENSFPVGDELRRVLIHDPVKFQSTLTEVTFGVVPLNIGEIIHNIEGFDRFVGIAYIVDDELYGTSVLSFRTDKPNPSLEILNLFANMVAVSLKRKLAEEAQHESEEKYRSLINEVNDGYYIVNEQGVITFSNNALAKMLGFSKSEEIIDHNIIEFIKQDKIGIVSGVFQNALSNIIQSDAFEIEAHRINGQTIYLSITFVPIKKNNKVIGLRGTIRDITERNRVEEELRRIGTAIEQTADWVVITDKEGMIQYVNPAFTKISGFSKEEALGKTPRILKSGHHPPPLKFYETLWETILQGEVYSTTFTNKRKDGELIYEYETITPIKDKEGTITHFVSTGKEITEQRLAEEEIISQKNKFAQLFDNSPIAIASLDDKDKIAFINESFSNLFGYYIEEIKGKSLNDIIVPPELKEEAKRYSDQTHEGSQINKENYRRRKDGTLVYVQIVGVPVIINEKTVGIYVMYVDLTQRKISEEELIKAKEKAEEMNRLKTNFLANMSHELRTPLIGINGFSDILRQDIENPELKEMAEIIFNSGIRLSETLNLILDLSKFESGDMGFTYQHIDLVSETEMTISTFKAAASKKGLYLKLLANQPSIFINTDPRALHSILNNLINNAIKYTNEGGIAVDISLKDKFVEIKVIDSGIGIAKEYHEIIFDEFRQVSEGYSRNFEGTGLGLNITKKLVEKFGGEISIESEPGKGSTFIVKLPVTNAGEIAVEKNVIKKAPLAVLTGQKSVKPLALLVDDDLNVCPVLNRYIGKQIDLESTPDGEFAVKLCRQKQYDIIFMDINLRRGLDGKQTAQAIRKIKGYENVPIIALTAYAMAGDKEEFLTAGCSHYLPKPFGQQEISNLLEEISSGR
jgi:PAS domain S-box-containing protein